LNGSEFYLEDNNDSVALSFGLINDIHGQPSLIISAQMSRDAYKQGHNTFFLISQVVGILGLSTIVVSLFLINNVVLSRVTKLEDNVRRIGRDGGNNRRLEATGNDEVFSLSQEINSMVESIEKRNQDLQESEERYKAIMEQSVGAIFIVDSEKWSIQQANSAFLKLFGYSEASIQQLPVSALSPSDSSDLENILKRITRENPIVAAELNMRNQNGKVLEIEISGSMIEHGGNKMLCITAWDVTERHQFESEMARNQKLESLGVLAGGIAHDFNNILTSIVSNIEISMTSLPDGDKQKHRLEESVRSAMRAKSLTQRLLTFSKGGQPVKEKLDIAGLLRSSIEFVLAGSKVVANYDIKDDLNKISADPAQMEQVINNLVINSMQAMSNGGQISVRAENVMIEDQTLFPIANGPYVKIDIADEGVGIPEEDLDRIFDPFYTTKETGTGLGLSTVRSIVRNHGGTVQVDSILGKGTTVTMVLPTANGYDQAPSSKTPAMDVTRHGRILVMDDEEPILEVLEIMLGDLGNEVTCVNNGEKAIAAYRDGLTTGRPFDLVIMDLTIKGGMGGKETIVEILALDPHARVIVSSGYSNDPIMAHPKEYGFRDVLMKPFTGQELAARVSSVMDQKKE
jgi:two-component system cell cycle sensor histidine kinase/response regulator CckA